MRLTRGSPIITANGGDSNRSRTLDRGSVQHRIAVADQSARIRSVELRFSDFDPDDGDSGKTLEQQAIYRIWHEEYPPAAVLQDSVTRVVPQRGTADTHRAVPLPYRMDRATVFLRGFRFRFSDGEPREFESFWASILNGDVVPFDDPVGSAAVFATTPSGTISLRFEGQFFAGNTGLPVRVPSEVKIYYSILAWDSR